MFKIGQKIVCIENPKWLPTVIMVNRPKPKEVCEVIGFSSANGIDLILKGYETNSIGGENAFRSINFKPIEYQSSSKEILEKFKLVEERADVKIKELEKL